MKVGPVLFSVVLLALAGTPLAAQADAGFLVVVNSGNPTRELDAQTVARIFLKKWKRWDDGVEVVPVSQIPASSVRDGFSRSVHGRDVSAIQKYWQRMIFSGRDVPPPELAGDQEVLHFVRANRGAIGYVSPSAPLGEGVRVLRIVGKVGPAPPPPPTALAFAIDPGDPRVLYASFTGQGLQESLDGGETWSRVGVGLRIPTIRAIATDPNRPGLVYAGGYEGLDRSLDGARSFTPVPEAPLEVVFVRIDPRASTLYVVARDRGLLRSDDGGATFVGLERPLALAFADSPRGQVRRSLGLFPETVSTRLTAFGLGPSGRLLAAVGGVVLDSHDRGESWRLLGLAKAQVRDFAADPQEPQTVFAATALGVLRSFDGGRHFELGGGALKDVQSLSLAPPALFAVAASGIYRSFDDGQTWERLLENPAEVVVVDPSNRGRIFAASYGQVYRTFDQGASWRGHRFPFVETKPEVFAGRKNETKPEVFAGRPKEEPPPIPLRLREGKDGDHVTAIVFDPEDSDVVYAAARNGVWKSTNGGRQWSHASVGLELLDVHALAVDPRQASILYAGTHGAGVFKSADGAASWIDARSGLDDLLVRALAVDPHMPSTVYAATRRGLYASTDGGASWKELVAIGRRDGLSFVEDVRALGFDERYGLQVTAGTVAGTFYAGDAAAQAAILAPGRLAVDAERAEAGCRDSVRGAGEECLRIFGMNPEALVPRALAFLPRSTTALAATPFGVWSGQAAPRGGEWKRLDLSTNVAAVDASGEDLWVGAADGLWRSSNEGFSWTRTSVESPVFSTAVEPGGDALFLGLDGGVYRYPLRPDGEERRRFQPLPPLPPPGTGPLLESRRLVVPQEVTPVAVRLWKRIRKTPPHQMRLRVLLAAELAGRGPAEHTELLRQLLIKTLTALYERDDDIRKIGFSPDSRWLQTSYLLDDDVRIHSEMRLYKLDSLPKPSELLHPEILHWVELHQLASEPEHLRPRWVLPDAGPVLAWSGDGRYVATHAGLDRVRVSSLASPIANEVSPPPRAPAVHHFTVDVPAGVTAAAVDSDGRSFAVAGQSGADAVVSLARIQAAETQVRRYVLEGTPGRSAALTHLVFVPGRQLLLFDQDGVVRKWNGDGEPAEIYRATARFRTVELTPNLRWLTGMTEDELLLWRIKGKDLPPPSVVAGQPRSFLMSPGGAWLLVRDGGRIRLFDLREGKLGPSVVQAEDVGRQYFDRRGENLLLRDRELVTVYDLTKQPIRPKLLGAKRPIGWDLAQTISRDLLWAVRASGIDLDLWEMGLASQTGHRLRAGRFGPMGLHTDLPYTKLPHPLPPLPEDGLEKLSLVALRNFACEVVGRSLTRQEWAAYLGEEPYQETCVVKEKKDGAERPEDG